MLKNNLIIWVCRSKKEECSIYSLLLFRYVFAALKNKPFWVNEPPGLVMSWSTILGIGWTFGYTYRTIDSIIKLFKGYGKDLGVIVKK